MPPRRRTAPWLKALSLLLAGSGILSGCEYHKELMRPAVVLERSQDRGEGEAQTAPKPLDLDSFKFDSNERETAYVLASRTPESRNRLQDILLRRSDVSCESYKDGMYLRVAGRKVGLRSTALFATTAAAIVEGATAQSLLAGIAAATIGVDAILDAEALQNQFITIIVSEIDSSRVTLIAEIMTKRRDRPSINDYSVDEAIRDAGRYHTACGFLPAVVGLAAKAQRTPVSLDQRKSAIAAEIRQLETDLETPDRPGEGVDRQRVEVLKQQLLNLDRLSGLLD